VYIKEQLGAFIARRRAAIRVHAPIALTNPMRRPKDERLLGTRARVC
jgi:hypothetical protein